MSEHSTVSPTVEEQVELARMSIRDGYRGLVGIFCGLLVAETVLYIGGVDGEPPKLFLGVALLYALRQYFHIKHAKQRLEELKS